MTIMCVCHQGPLCGAMGIKKNASYLQGVVVKLAGEGIAWLATGGTQIDAATAIIVSHSYTQLLIPRLYRKVELTRTICKIVCHVAYAVQCAA